MLTKVDIFDRFDKISAKLPGPLYKPVVKLLKRAAGELGYIMGDTCLKMLILTNEKGTKSELKEMKQAGERELKSVMVKAKKDFFDLARESNVKLNAEQRFLIKKFFA